MLGCSILTWICILVSIFPLFPTEGNCVSVLSASSNILVHFHKYIIAISFHAESPTLMSQGLMNYMIMNPGCIFFSKSFQTFEILPEFIRKKMRIFAVGQNKSFCQWDIFILKLNEQMSWLKLTYHWSKTVTLILMWVPWNAAICK